VIDIGAYDFVIDTIRDGYKNHFILIHWYVVKQSACLQILHFASINVHWQL
jgi:hypothetical protein